jgi:hypothetical protein
MSKRLLFSLLFVCLGLASLAQNRRFTRIEGMVIDSTTRQPVQGASVKVDFRKVGINTDKEGKFVLTIPEGDFVITISYVGYLTFRKSLRQEDYQPSITLNVALRPLAQELEEVIVSSQGAEKNVNRPLLGVNQLSIKTLKKIPAFMGETDVLRGLQMLPGVTSVGEAANGVNIRGGTTDQNLILIDDMIIFNPTHLFGLFSVFPPDAISNVELYKGGIPSRFGGRASAILDVSMALPNLEKFKMQGGISPVTNRVTLDVPIIKNKLGVIVAGRGAFNDFWFKLGPEKLKNISANFGDLGVKMFYKIDPKNTLTWSSYLSTDFFQTDLLGTVDNINATSTQYKYTTANTMLRWFHSFSEKTNVQTTFVAGTFNPTTLLPELNSDNKVEIASGINYQNLKASVGILPNKSHKIEVGASAMRYVIAPGELRPGTSTSTNARKVPEENSLELGVYADDEIILNKDITLLVGIRYSHFIAQGAATVRNYRSGEIRDDLSATDSTVYKSGETIQTYGGIEPRMALKISLDESSSFKLGYSLMRQYIQVISNTTTPLPTARWKTSDNYIRPQVSQLFSAGYFKNFKDNIYEMSLEGYYRITDNVLDYRPGADFLFQKYLETQVLQGQNKSYGVELMVTKKKGEMTGWLSYTYSRSLNQINEGPNFKEQINGGEWYAANYDRPHTLNATMNIAASKVNTFSFNFSYSTGRPFTIPTSIVGYQGQSYPFYDERNNARIKDYHRLDFSWTIDQPSKNQNRRWKGSWVFTVYNLYGRSNAYSVFLRAEKNVLKPYQLTIFGSPFLSLTYNFKF